MKVAVTGASGHVGNVLCRELIKQGHWVKALIHRDTDDLESIGVEMVQGDLMDINSLEKLCMDCEVVYHLAAKISIDEKEKDLVRLTNVTGTQNLIKAAIKTGIKKFIHFSTIHVLDPFPLDEELNETRPYIGHTHMIYEQSKTESEKLVLAAVQEGLHAVIITPTAIIGPYDYKPSFLGQALIKMVTNSLPMLVPGGYNWVDIRDVVTCAIAAAEKGRQGERYIASGHYLSLKNLSQMISKVTGRKTPSFTGPTILAKIGLPFIVLYSKLKNEAPLYTSNSLEILKNSNRRISHAKATAELNYQPRPLEETFMDTFDWFNKNGLIDK
jgi:dihydroflavonol-4-reductase